MMIVMSVCTVLFVGLAARWVANAAGFGGLFSSAALYRPETFGVRPLMLGAAIATLNRDSGGCLQANEPFNEQGTAVTGTVYRIASSQGCKDRLPGFVGQAVLVVDGKIYRRMTDPRPPPPPAAPVAVPDAGAPQQAAAPRKPAPRPDAGEPEYRIYVPGNPMPENEKPAAGGEQQQR